MKLFSFIARIKQSYYTRQLKHGIVRHDLAMAKEAVRKGARLDGWTGRGPCLTPNIHGPGIFMKPRGSLELAYHHGCTPEFFELLLDAGANTAEFTVDTDLLRSQAERLDRLGRTRRYGQWLKRHGGTVEHMFRVFATQHALIEATPARSGTRPVGRL